MKKIFSIFTILIVLLTACNDELLEKLPKTSIDVDNFFKSEQDLKLYTHGLYDFADEWQFIADAGVTDNMSDNLNSELKNMMVFGSPSSSTITGGWGWGQLRRINIFLDNSARADVPANVLAHYDGVARFFRAKFYMGKVKRFSDVPWYDTEIGTSDDSLLYKATDPRDMVVQNLFADYEFAVSNVKTNQPVGSVDKFVVQAFQARHALHEGTFRKYHPELEMHSSASTYLELARDAAKAIMDNGGYSIHNNYSELFTNTDLSTNNEVILGNFFQNTIKNSDESAFNGNEIAFGNYDCSPTKELMQAYLMTDGTPFTQQAGYETFSYIEEFVNRDPRLSQTYAYPGWNKYYDGNYVPSLMKNFTGYHNIKNWVDSNSLDVKRSIDFPVIRYAEILLIYAEARAELGELTQADLDATINVLRDRVDMPFLMLNPPVDPIQQAMYPNIVSTQSAEVLEIRRERRIEMALEGYRYDDLMRWAAGKVNETEPNGMYFPGLGKYDLTGDGVDDVILIDASESVPAEKEKNSLGVTLIYYKVGPVGNDAATFWLTEGTSGYMISDLERGTFEEPKFYYRPIPEKEVQLNPNLTQIFGWY